MLIVVRESKLSEAPDRGVKTMPANSAPKDPADREKMRAQAKKDGYSGLRFEHSGKQVLFPEDMDDMNQ
jgi:hypothetical protein